MNTQLKLNSLVPGLLIQEVRCMSSSLHNNVWSAGSLATIISASKTLRSAAGDPYRECLVMINQNVIRIKVERIHLEHGDYIKVI